MTAFCSAATPARFWRCPALPLRPLPFTARWNLIRSRILIRSGAIFDQTLARPLIERVLSRSAASTEAQGAQSLRDLDQLRDFLAGSAPVVFCDAPWTPLFVGLAWLMHPWLGLAALAGIGGLLVLTLATEWATRPALNAASASASAAVQISATAMRNRDVVAALGMAGRFADRWSGKHEAVIALQTRASDRAALIVSVSRTYRLILQSGMLGLGAWLAIHQEITVGSMFAANLLIGRALQPVEQVVQHWKGFIVAREAYARLTAVLAAGEGPAQRMDLPAPTGHVSVEQLAVCAPHAAKPALAGVSFRLAAGEMMTVVGASGGRQVHADQGAGQCLVARRRGHPPRRCDACAICPRTAGFRHWLPAAGG